MKNKKITKKELEDHIKELEDRNVLPKTYRVIGGAQFIEECYEALHEYAKNMTIDDWEDAMEKYKNILKEIEDESTKRN